MPYSLLYFTKFYEEAEKVLTTLNSFTLNIVKNRRKNKKLPEDEGYCFIDVALESPIDGELMTDEEARDELNTVVLGLHDTVKTAATFLMYNLAKYPDVQDKVYREIKTVMNDDLSRKPTEKEIEKLAYLDAVIKENLRLYPPVPFLRRKLRTAKQINEFIFPEDVEILISPYLMMRNPKYFDDPLTFNPDRFLDLAKTPLAFSAYSIGARKCIGGKYAVMILKSVTANLLLQYKLAIPEGQKDVEVSIKMTLTPIDRFFISLENRA